MTFGILALGFLVSLPYLNAFLRWRLASWLWGTFGILALGFPVSEVLQVSQVLQFLGAHSLTFFPILMHSLGDVWHPGSGVPCFGGFCSLWGLTVSLSSLFFPILMHSLGDVWHPGSGVRLASWLWGSLFRRFCRFRKFCSLWGLTVSRSSLFFPILMHSLGDVWHPGSGVPCFGGFCSLWGLTVSLSSLFFPILMHSLGDVWHPGSGVRLASWLWGSLFRRFCRFRRFCSLWGLTVSLSSLFFPILMHSLGDVWHPGSGSPCFGGCAGFAGFAAFGGSQSHFLPYSSLS